MKPRSGLTSWFGKGPKGGVGGGGWDRYNLQGERIGKCGEGKEGDAYAACLSREKAKQLGKSGIRSFVRRKREAQRAVGQGKKGEGRGSPTYVKTGASSGNKSR